MQSDLRQQSKSLRRNSYALLACLQGPIKCIDVYTCTVASTNCLAAEFISNQNSKNKGHHRQSRYKKKRMTPAKRTQPLNWKRSGKLSPDFCWERTLTTYNQTKGATSQQKMKAQRNIGSRFLRALIIPRVFLQILVRYNWFPLGFP